MKVLQLGVVFAGLFHHVEGRLTWKLLHLWMTVEILQHGLVSVLLQKVLSLNVILLQLNQPVLQQKSCR